MGDINIHRFISMPYIIIENPVNLRTDYSLVRKLIGLKD